MNKVTLIKQITTGQWLIDQDFADAFLPSVEKMLQGEPVSFYDESIEENEKVNAAYILSPAANASFEQGYTLNDEIEENSIGVLQLRGVVMKEDYCGVPGTASLMYLAKEMANNPKIGSLLFIQDSGGGAVDGTFELADAIAEIAKTKPVIGFVDGLSASASIAILSKCTKLVASHKTSKIGSIGVATSIRDFSEHWEKAGVKEHYYTASTSPDKNKAALEARKGNPELLKSETLDPLHAIFKASVKEGRPNVKDEALTGSMYLAEKAIEMGLIDAIGTFETAVNEAYKLSLENKNYE